MTAKLQGGTAHSIRVGASEVILRDHLPVLMQEVRKKFPKLKMVLREGYQPQLEQWLDRQEIDLAFTLLNPKATATSKTLRLLELPLVLLVEKTASSSHRMNSGSATRSRNISSAYPSTK